MMLGKLRNSVLFLLSMVATLSVLMACQPTGSSEESRTEGVAEITAQETVETEETETETETETEHVHEVCASVEVSCTEEGVEDFLCFTCGERWVIVIPPAGHSFGEWETTSDAHGVMRRVCSQCGAEETETETAVQ